MRRQSTRCMATGTRSSAFNVLDLVAAKDNMSIIDKSVSVAILTETRRLLTEVGWWRGVDDDDHHNFMMGAIDENDEPTGLQYHNIKAYTLTGAFQKAMFNLSGTFHTGFTGKLAELYLEAAIKSVIGQAWGWRMFNQTSQEHILQAIDKSIEGLQE